MKVKRLVAAGVIASVMVLTAPLPASAHGLHVLGCHLLTKHQLVKC